MHREQFFLFGCTAADYEQDIQLVGLLLEQRKEPQSETGSTTESKE